MTLLTLDNLKKHYGPQEVLNGASMMFDAHCKVGIVGRNGGGKTTLIRMIIGEEMPDWGKVRLAKGARLGHVPQRPQFGDGITVRAYVESGLNEVRGLIEKSEQIGERMGEVDGDALERLMKEHDRVTHRIEELGGWETDRRTATVLSGIGLDESLWDREAGTLSGGEQSRAALARELVAGHDILLLDEPTNHLDLVGIEWLERYLKDLKTAVLVVSHDRRLLDNMVDSIVELERGQLKRWPGNYTRYVTLKAERFDSDLRAYEIQADQLRKEESFIKKHMGSQRTAEAKGRLKKLSHVVRLVRPHHDVRTPTIRPPEAARGGELVLRTEALSGGYPNNILFDNVNLRIGRGQRIGIVGPNGSGKSTLLKILARQMEPLSGQVQRGHGALCSYYDQDTSGLREDSTPFGEIKRHYPTLSDLEVRNHLARFLFRGNEVDKPVPALSGGERARVALALLVMEKPSWMALDEPTNHLDLASRTSLEEMLSEFEGALLCISHDRAFLDGICNHIIEVSQEGVREFKGNYSKYRATKDLEQEEATAARALKASAQRKSAQEQEAKAKAAQKSNAKGAGQKQGGGGKVRNPYMFEKLEKRIMKLEEKLEKLHAGMTEEDVFRDPEKLRGVQFDIAEVEHELTEANEEWENWG